MRSEDAPPTAFTDQLEVWLHANDFSDKTIYVYSTAADRWLRYARPWEERWQVRSIQWRKSMTHMALKTQSVFVSAAKGFIGWLIDADVLHGKNPLMSVKFRGLSQNSTKRRALSDNEVKQLLSLCDLHTDTGLRDRAILMIMLHTALRIGGISMFLVEDIEKRGELWVVKYQGKGQQSKARVKVMPPNVMNSVRAYLKKTNRTLDDTGPLWVTTTGKLLSVHGIRKSIVRKLSACGIKDSSVTTHSMRHTAATKALEGGVELEDIQELLDHGSIATTSGYVHSRRKLAQAASLTIDYGLENKDAKRRRTKRARQGKTARRKAD